MKTPLSRTLFILLIAIGCAFLFGLCAPSLHSYWRTRDRITADAELLAVEEKPLRVRKGARTETLVRYRYRFRGQSHEGDNVSIFRHSQRFYPELKAVIDRNRTIKVYIDPRNPEYSVIDRRFSPWPFSGGLIMGSVFLALGTHGLRHTLRKTPQL